MILVVGFPVGPYGSGLHHFILIIQFTSCVRFVPGICLCDICVFFFSSRISLGDLLLDSYSLLVIILLLHRNSSFSVTGAWVLWGLVVELQAVPAIWLVLHKCTSWGSGYRASVGLFFPGYLHMRRISLKF